MRVLVGAALFALSLWLLDSLRMGGAVMSVRGILALLGLLAGAYVIVGWVYWTWFGEGFRPFGGGLIYKDEYAFRVITKDEAEYLTGGKRAVVAREIGRPGAFYITVAQKWDTGESMSVADHERMRNDIAAVIRKKKWDDVLE